MNHFHKHSTNLEDLISSIPTYNDVKSPAELFSILSDPTRLRILWVLCHTTDCVLDIAQAVDMSSPAVSHHLKLLKKNGIIKSKKVGKEMHYSLADNEIAKLLHSMLDNMLHISCPNNKQAEDTMQ